MTVYHGSLVEVPVPELRESENVGDFGRGFYVTRSHEQATRFVRTKAKRESLTRGFVSEYELDEDVLHANFKGLVFDGPTREWARFVSDNRKRPSFSHGYDFVMGPVANDHVYATFSFYESGMISFEMLLDQLRVRKLFDQILLHTRESIGLLRFVRSEEMSWQKITQANVYLLLPWKVAGVSKLWARDLGITPLEALERFYATPFYARLADESTKLWHYSPEQLYVLFAA